MRTAESEEHRSDGSRDIILQTCDVTRRFGGLVAVDRVNLALRNGEVRALIGPNGAGKSTLFNLVTGEIQPTSGRIFFADADITRLPPYRRAKLGLSRSFQLVNIFSEASVKKNVEIAVQAAQKRKNHPFERVDRKEVQRRTERIFDTYSWRADYNIKAGQLVYGEQRKLEILLALALDPKLLLLDEPTAGVDEKDIGQIIEMIRNVSRNKTVLLTDHDVKFVMQVADYVSVLDQGAVVAEGDPAAIAADPRVDEIYFGGAE